LTQVVPGILRAELQNIPRTIKELFVVFTPGGLLALFLGINATLHRKQRQSVKFRLAVIICMAAISLILAYCMLVVISRYFYPLVAIFIAFSIGFLFDKEIEKDLVLAAGWRRLSWALVALGLVFSTTYHSSPFRTLTRDFQLSCFDAAEKLSEQPGSAVVTMGYGPFPEHGVGYDAGWKAAYFADKRVVAETHDIPSTTDIPSVLSDLRKSKADIVMIWGKPQDSRYLSLRAALLGQGLASKAIEIRDPEIGEVGCILPLSNN